MSAFRHHSALLLLSLALAAAASSSFAQHDGHPANVPAAPERSKYAGLQARAIKALSPEQVDDLRAGRGMTMALAAELNGYPGPAHVLELADALQLTTRQRHDTSHLMAAMTAQARSLGEEVIQAEADLDRLFSQRTVTPEALTDAVERVASAQSRLRAAHLSYHLAMADLLTAEQVSRYNRLRGYTVDTP